MWRRIWTNTGRPAWAATPPDLGACQSALRWLEKHTRPHPAAHGYIPGRSVVTALTPHLGCAYLAHLDIVSFFPSTTEQMVVQGLLACQRQRIEAEAIAAICCHRRRLPVGACTSPWLSNLACIGLDTALSGYRSYTRYSDQILVSSQSPLDEGWIRDQIKDAGYRVNERKSVLLVRGRTEMRVMGWVIGEDRIRRPREARKAERSKRFNEEKKSGS